MHTLEIFSVAATDWFELIVVFYFHSQVSFEKCEEKKNEQKHTGTDTYLEILEEHGVPCPINLWK